MQPESQNADKYDFIMSDRKPAPKPNPLANVSKQGKILIIAGAAVGLIILVAIVSAIFFSNRNEPSQSVVAVAAKQTELIRIAGLGIKGSKTNGVAQVLATNTQQTIQTDQAALIKSLSAQGYKLGAPQLNTSKDPTFDESMKQARLANTFDESFTAKLRLKLVAYQKAVKLAYDQESNPRTRQTLSECYNHATQLIPAQKIISTEQ